MILDWIVWSVGCVAFLVGLTLIRSGRVIGRAALLFTIGAAVALAVTLFTDFSKLHLLWILPVLFAASGVLAVWFGLRMMREGIRQAAANPEFQRALKDAIKEAEKPSDKNTT